MKRPLVAVTAAFVAGMFAASAGVCSGIVTPLAILAVGVLMTVRIKSVQITRPGSVLLFAFAAGALMWNVRHADLPGDPLSRSAAARLEVKEWTLEGTVRLTDLEEANPDSYQFQLDVDRAWAGNEALDVTGGVSVGWTNPDRPVFARERVRVRGRLNTSLSRVNFETNSYEDYLRGQGIHSAIRVRGPEGVEWVAAAPRWSIAYWVSRFRVDQAHRIEQAVPKSAQSFVLAVWLGYRTTIPPDEYQAYIESGTVHILSVSGVHMAMVFWTATFIARLFVKGIRPRAVVVLTVIVLFTLMSGMRPSALRSAIMVIAYLMADLFDRERDVPTALSLSALLLLIWNPDTFFDAGFQLSFLSVASILLFSEGVDAILSGEAFRSAADPIDEKTPTWSPAWLPVIGLRKTIATSLGVQVLPTPVAIRCFHVFPLLSVVANLFVIPLATIALWLCFMTSLAGLVSSDAALLFGSASLPVVSAIRAIAMWVAAPKVTHLTLVSPTFIAVACYYGFAACTTLAAREERRRVWLTSAAVFLTLALVFWRPWFPEPTVVFLDVGHGDSTFVRSPGGKTMLVDGGDQSMFADMGRRVVTPFLRSNDVARLDCVALSHPDRDHIGGLFYILEHFPVGTVFLSAHESDQPLEQRLLDVCARQGVPVRRLHAGDTFDLDGMRVEALHPPAQWPSAESINNQSLVLRLDWEGTRVLLTGDIELPAEAAISRRDCRAEILKVPHHGSRTSSSEGFVTAVRPQECIVSTGGRTGHEPADDAVLARYRAHGVQIWRTDILGGIRLVRRHGAIAIEAARTLFEAEDQRSISSTALR